jgi:hypothetical protein
MRTATTIDADESDAPDDAAGEGDGGGCRSAQGAALQAEQRDASGLMLIGVGGHSRRVSFVRP